MNRDLLRVHVREASDIRPHGLRESGPHPYRSGPLVLCLTACAWGLMAAVLYGFFLVTP